MAVQAKNFRAWGFEKVEPRYAGCGNSLKS
jgi:hypothetical protein